MQISIVSHTTAILADGQSSKQYICVQIDEFISLLCLSYYDISCIFDGTNFICHRLSLIKIITGRFQVKRRIKSHLITKSILSKINALIHFRIEQSYSNRWEPYFLSPFNN
jgi:hypothetical protein